MALAEIAEIVRVNNLSSNPGGLYDSARQESTVNPLLHFFRTNVQRLRQRMFREPILTHASTRSEPVQHRAH
jgi:hypothetical protein